MTKIKLAYINEYTDSRGRVVRYVRRKGKPLVRLPGLPGSPEFMKAYHLALAVKSEPQPHKTGTIGGVVTRFYRSVEFTNLSIASQGKYRLVLDKFAREDGHRTVRGLPAPIARRIIEDIGETRPGMANLTKSVLHTLFEYAITLDLRTDNPFSRIRRYRLGSHHTWTDAELDRYRERWPLGTRERLAFAVLLYSGQRVSDAVRLQRSDIMQFKQRKTGAELSIPAHPALIRAVQAGPSNGIYIIGDERGRPIAGDTLSLLIRNAVREAGLSSRCKAHGLRKAIQRILAENSATTKQMQAISGHKSLKETERYSDAANQARMAAAAIALLPDERRTGSD
jgi:integrase